MTEENKNAVATTGAPSELQAALGRVQSVISVIPSHKIGEDDIANALVGATSLAQARDIHESQNSGKPFVLEIVGMAVSPVEYTTQDGEHISGLAAVLLSKSGAAYYTRSQPLMRSIGTIVGLKGDPSRWKSALKIRFYLRKAGQNYINSLELVK